MAEIGQLVTKIVGEDAGLQATLNKVKKSAEDTKQSLDNMNKSVGSTGKSINQMQGGVNQGTMALMSMNYIISDMPYGLRGISNNIQMTVQQMALMSTGADGLKGALSAVGAALKGPMGIVIGVTALMATLEIAQNGIMGFTKKVKDAKTATQEFAKWVLEIEKGMKERTAEELAAEKERLQFEIKSLETRRQILEDIKRTPAGQTLSITETEAKALGIGGSGGFKVNLMDFFKTIDLQLENLRMKIGTAKTELLGLPNVVTAKAPKSPADLEKDALDRAKERVDLNKQFEDDEKQRAEDWHKDEKTAIQIQYEFESELETDKWKHKDAEVLHHFKLERDKLLELNLSQEKKAELLADNQKVYDGKIKQNQLDHLDEIAKEKEKQDKDALDNIDKIGQALHRAFSKTGNDFVDILMRALMIARAIQAMSMKSETKEGMGFGDYVTGGLTILGGLFGKNTPSSMVSGVPIGGNMSSNQPGYMIVDMVNGKGFVFKHAREYDDFKKRKSV